MVAGDVEDLEPALVTFLAGIGAVEVIKDPPAPAEPEPEPESSDESSTVDATTQKSARAGRKEK